MRTQAAWRAASIFILAVLAARWAVGNGGPFVVKYPGGDPAAKGVLARLDPTLKPAQETRLRVVKEDLTIRFGTEPYRRAIAEPPLVRVSAVYTIENPTDQEVQVDFGFPILRGIYLIRGMGSSSADASLRVDNDNTYPRVISNSLIYGLIRQNARELIEKRIEGDPELRCLVAAVREAWAVAPQQPAPAQQTAVLAPAPLSMSPSAPLRNIERRPTAAYLSARGSLRNYLMSRLGWNPRDAALMVEYASMDLGPLGQGEHPRDSWDAWAYNGVYDDTVKTANLGPLMAVGEQKATQLFAQLASQFDEKAGSNYEAIFAAWGGDVRERSIDLASGQLRPREISLPTPPSAEARSTGDRRLTADPTVYARVDYLDPNAKISATDKASCEAVLKNLPVTFTFAPMNLLHYQVKFPARGNRVVAVAYKQYAYADTRGTGSYQLAYVLHPATLWKDFGPMHVTIVAPKGILCRASVPLRESREELPAEGPPEPPTDQPLLWAPGSGYTLPPRAPAPAMQAYQATLDRAEEKRGELFVGMDKAAWDAMFSPDTPKPTPPLVPPPAVPPPPKPAGPNASDPFE